MAGHRHRHHATHHAVDFRKAPGRLLARPLPTVHPRQRISRLSLLPGGPYSEATLGLRDYGCRRRPDRPPGPQTVSTQLAEFVSGHEWSVGGRLFPSFSAGAAQPFQASAQSIRKQSAEDHVAWVAQGLKRMQTIKPGLARHALLIRVHPRSSAAILPFSSFSPSPSAHFTQFHIDPKRLTSSELARPRYNSIGRHIRPPNRALIGKDGKLKIYQTNSISPPNPKKMKPLAPSLTEPDPRRPPHPPASLRTFDKSNTLMSCPATYGPTRRPSSRRLPIPPASPSPNPSATANSPPAPCRPVSASSRPTSPSTSPSCAAARSWYTVKEAT